MSVATLVATAASGIFLFVGLLTGIWKYRGIMASPERQAHRYVDIAHRAALMYSFAALVLGKLAESSALPDTVNLAAVALPLAFFAIAIGTYVRLGIARSTDNQYKRRTFTTTWGMWLLIGGEVGGVAVLLVGFAITAFR